MADPVKRVPGPPRHCPPARGTTAGRGYGTAHQAARRRLIAERPVCELCRAAFSTDMHHVNGDPHDRRPGNLQMLCEQCHHGAAHRAG